MKDKEYIKPIERQIEILNAARAYKGQNQEIKIRIAEEILQENPDISKEKTIATVLKKVTEKKLKEQQEKFYGVTEESFKPDMKGTVRRNVVKKFKHDGCFQYNESLEKEIWSCCANEDKASNGCVVTYKDLDKWQTISF